MAFADSQLTRLESVRKRPTRGNGTLRVSRHTIHVWSFLLKKPVPMNRCALFWDGVVDSYLKPVAPICFEDWARKFIVNE